MSAATPTEDESSGLLRRHEVERAEDGARRGLSGIALLGETEVNHLDLFITTQQEIGRFDVAVDQVMIVRLLKAGGGLGNPGAGAPDVGRAVAADIALQIAAFDQLHGQIQEPGFSAVRRRHMARVKRRDDVRVVKARQHAHLGIEP